MSIVEFFEKQEAEDQKWQPKRKRRKLIRPKQSAAFVATIWPEKAEYINDEFYEEIIEEARGGLRFLAYGEEVTPTTGKIHHQAFLYFFSEKATSKTNCIRMAKNLFGTGVAWMDWMKGGFQDNESYCSKESALKKFGTEPKQGLRSDLVETVHAISVGDLSVHEIMMEDPSYYHQYKRTFMDVQAVANRKLFRDWMTEGIWLWGPSGTGKSEFAYKDFNPLTHYNKPLEDRWWDGYTGQEIVILNEFRGNHMTLSNLLALVDRWPMSVQVRNREPVPFLAKKVIITSSMHPREIYESAILRGDSYKQIERRFDIIECVYDEEKAGK